MNNFERTRIAINLELYQKVALFFYLLVYGIQQNREKHISGVTNPF